MKADTGLKYIFYITLFLVFIIIRVNYILNTGGLYEVEYKTIAVASSSFPVGIIKNSIFKDYFMPPYYLIIHFFLYFKKSEIFLRIINLIISFSTIVVIIQIAKKLLNRKFAILLGLFISINHFFLFYTNLIAPYCLNFFVSVLVLNFLIDFLRKPSKKTLNKLGISNAIFILTDSLGIIFVLSEIIVLYFSLNKKRNFYKKAVICLIIEGFFAFLVAFLPLVVHYFTKINLLIPDNYNRIGLNLNSIYLLLNEFTSPYLSFSAEIAQSKSTLGMLYTFFLNPDISNINSFKILITLFYSSFLPLALLIYCSITSFKKSYKFKILISVAILNFAFFLICNLFEVMEVHPAYLITFYMIELFILFYGIFEIEDVFIRRVVLFCLILIQAINPGVNSYNITADKSYPSLGCFEVFKNDFIITQDDYIIMPYMSKYAKLRYRDFDFFDFDYSMLKDSKRSVMVKNIANKKIKSINKNNFQLALSEYLSEKYTNSFFAKYFADNLVEKTEDAQNIIIVVDKLNAKPVSQSSVAKVANIEKYNPHPVNINFRKANLRQNQSSMLYDALKTKAFFDILNLVSENYYLYKIFEYGKNDGDFYKISKNSYNILNAINSFDSDYVFLVFRKM